MEIENIITDFITVCKLANIHNIERDDITIETLTYGENHNQKKLPNGQIAVYIFRNPNCDICYKVGKVGTNSNARYQVQHYSPNSSKSNLANSILNDPKLNDNEEIQLNVGEWIKKNTTRTNILLKAEKGIFALNLLEAFVQNRLNPIYEGYKSQKIE